jgi:hypothetical protein
MTYLALCGRQKSRSLQQQARLAALLTSRETLLGCGRDQSPRTGPGALRYLSGFVLLTPAPGVVDQDAPAAVRSVSEDVGAVPAHLDRAVGLRAFEQPAVLDERDTASGQDLGDLAAQLDSAARAPNGNAVSKSGWSTQPCGPRACVHVRVPYARIAVATARCEAHLAKKILGS